MQIKFDLKKHLKMFPSCYFSNDYGETNKVNLRNSYTLIKIDKEKDSNLENEETAMVIEKLDRSNNEMKETIKDLTYNSSCQATTILQL